jgi:hypothetical protein
MVLIEGKLYENKLFESKYPECNIEIVYSPDRPGVDFVRVTEECIAKQQPMIERIHESNLRLNKLLDLLILSDNTY